MTQLNYRMVEANGLRMRIADHGAGPLVLLCHGFPETSYAWRHQLRALAARGYRAVAPDLRGFGGSSAPQAVEAYALQVLVGDMVALLDTLGVESTAIVGNDWGATLAWQAALLRPDRFRAAAAIGVPIMGQPPVPPTQLFPDMGDALFYTLYFQEEGVAEAEFEADTVPGNSSAGYGALSNRPFAAGQGDAYAAERLPEAAVHGTAQQNPARMSPMRDIGDVQPASLLGMSSAFIQ